MIVEQLKAAGLHRHDEGRRARDHREAVRHRPRVGARAAGGGRATSFRERQVFRIDHYLGKETVQNMMAFRFANMMFEPIWNRNYIDHIQITGAEDLGIGTRAGYYDQLRRAARPRAEPHAPARRAACMEPPASFEANKVRDEKVKVLHRDHAAAPRRSGATRCARSTAPAPSAGEDVAGLPRGGGRARRLAHRDVRRAASSRCTTGAGRACRSTCAPASGSRAR